MARFHWTRANAGSEPKSKPNEMKWLSGGLTFVNFATVCGLIIGMIFGGLSLGVALAALVLGAAFAFLAYLKTTDSKAEDNASNGNQSAFAKYRKLPIWILAAFF